MEQEEPKGQEIKLTQTPFEYEVTSEKPVSIDFSGHENQDASVLNVKLPTEGEQVKEPTGEMKVFVSTNVPDNNKIEICTFSSKDTEEKYVCFTATAEAEPRIHLEGPGMVIVSGIFANPFSEDEEEEEEESAENDSE